MAARSDQAEPLQPVLREADRRKRLQMLRREGFVPAGIMALADDDIGLQGDLPRVSGIYLFLVDDFDIGYVGAAQNLEHRVWSHCAAFNRQHPNPSVAGMSVDIRKFLKARCNVAVWICTNVAVRTPSGRIIDGTVSMEQDFITRFQPHWNVLGVNRVHKAFSDGARQANSSRTREERSAAARKAGETRRRRRTLTFAAADGARDDDDRRGSQ
jgi:hypothetical protein